MMAELATLVPAAFLRRRTSASRVVNEGCDAMRSSSLRKYSCIDWRLRAALAANSSRTASGTPRIVI